MMTASVRSIRRGSNTTRNTRHQTNLRKILIYEEVRPARTENTPAALAGVNSNLKSETTKSTYITIAV